MLARLELSLSYLSYSKRQGTGTYLFSELQLLPSRSRKTADFPSSSALFVRLNNKSPGWSIRVGNSSWSGPEPHLASKFQSTQYVFSVIFGMHPQKYPLCSG